MKRKLQLPLIAIALIVTLVIPATVFHMAAYAGDYAEEYTATLRYYDDIQITYTLNYPGGGIWSGAADIPVGGTGISSQIYCVDPFVPFHSLADQSYWDRYTAATVDIKDGYAAAAPWNASAAVRQNLDALIWLAQNGYRGDYLAGDAVSQASVARLQAFYPGIGAIDKKIALMATKVAMWKTIAGQSVEILRTSLDGSLARDTFDALVDLLIDDAASGNPASLDPTRLEMTINDEHVSAMNDAGYMYYGPLTVSIELKESSGDLPGLLDKVFLTASGDSSGGIDFVSGANSSADSISAGKSPDKLYGTDSFEIYLDRGDFTAAGGNALKSIPFYLKIPAARLSTDLLMVKAHAVAKDVPLVEGTPVIFVSGAADGTLDWNAVQAFIGGADDGVFANLYAEASASTHDTPLGQVYISKIVENGSPIDDDALFAFRLRYGADDDYANSQPVNLSDYPVSGAAGFDEAEKTFTLKNGGVAVFEGLPADYSYWAEEINVPAGYDAYYEITAAKSKKDRTAAPAAATDAFQMDRNVAMVTFYNLKNLPKAHLYVEKLAMAGFDFIMGAPFYFQLECSEDSGASWQPVELGEDVFKSGCGEIADAQNGIFMLETREKAFFELDPDKAYRVKEIGLDTDKYIPMYLYIHHPGDGSDPVLLDMGGGMLGDWRIDGIYTAQIGLDDDGEYMLGFVNQNILLYDLSISKTVVEKTPSDNLFAFKILCIDDNLGGIDSQYPWAVPLSGSVRPYAFSVEIGGADASGRIETDENGDTVLMLKHGETATIKQLPAGTYKIIESSASGYEAAYAIGAGEASEGRETPEFELSGDTLVRFTNTMPDVLGEAGSSGETTTETTTTTGTTTETTTGSAGGATTQAQTTTSTESATQPAIETEAETSGQTETTASTDSSDSSEEATEPTIDSAPSIEYSTEPTIYGEHGTIEIFTLLSSPSTNMAGLTAIAANDKKIESAIVIAADDKSGGSPAETTSGAKKIALQNGWSAEHVHGAKYSISDENGALLGHVELEAHEKIEEWEDYHNIIPIPDSPGEPDQKSPETQKGNPKTGDNIIFALSALFGIICLCAVVRKVRKIA